MRTGTSLTNRVVTIAILLALLSANVVGIAQAAVRTDKSEYKPGATVTISGDNSNDAGYLPGETVQVAVNGPNNYAASCSSTVNDNGVWSCQVVLAGDSSAIGPYSYTAIGQTSGVSESGAFSDADCTDYSTYPWADPAKSPDERASALLAASTLDQKLRWLDEQAANNPATLTFSGVTYPAQLPCTPIIQYTDGPQAVSGAGSTVITAFPSQIGLAASWDPAISRQKGQAQGYEAFHAHRNVILGPGIASGRVPLNGRNSEYMSEDPVLSGMIAGAIVRGIQEDNPNEPVESVVKHYVANEQETNRQTSSSNVDERALHEIYTLPFEIAIQQGHPYGVMCAYNQVNGIYSCENPTILNSILKNTIGFTGWVVSDFGAVHSTVPSLVAGLDQELNRPVWYTPTLLKNALTAGQITQAQIDNAAFRVVRSHIAEGLFDHALPPAAEANVSTPANQAVALQAAQASAVLLKNQDGILPLSGSGKTIAVIGQTASNTATGGISAASVCAYTNPSVPCTPVAPLAGITARAAQDGNTVVFNNGSDLAAAATTAAGANVAIVFGYYREGEGSDLPNLSLAPQASTTLFASAAAGDTNIKVASVSNIAIGSPLVIDTGASRETVKATVIGTAATNTTLALPSAAGATNIKVSSVGSVAVGDTLSIDTGSNLETVTVSAVGTAGGTTVRTATTAGATVIPVVSITGFSVGQSITIDSGASLETRTVTAASSSGSNPRITVDVALSYAHAVGAQVSGSGITFTPALSLAHASGAAVRDSGTGVTFTPALSQAHASGAAVFSSYGDALISAVAAANPNTIVILQTGGPVLMPWVNQVKGVLEVWYAGQRMGDAISALLWGDVNPSGKLPETFPVSASDLPTAGSVAQYPGDPVVNGIRQVSYSEALQVGYRWYDSLGIAPLFPFGFGLSYTTFDFSDLSINRHVDGTIEVSFTIKNTGTRAGAEVGQLYVGFPASTGEPPKQLKGFQKVFLQPGDSQRVTLTLDPRASSYWNTTTHNWKIEEGIYQMMVGASSRGIRLTGSVWQEWTPPTIDLVAPAEAVTQVAGASGNYPLNSIQNASYTCSDSQSGVATCSGTTANGTPFDTSTVGFHSFTVNAVDVAGNATSVTHQYNVYWPGWSNFYQPIDNGNVLNVATAGSAIPVKFSLGGNYGLGIFADNYPQSQVIACDSREPTDDIEQTVTAGGSSLTYDPVANQYIYVWKTDKTWKGTCRLLVVKLIDNTVHTAQFKFK